MSDVTVVSIVTAACSEFSVVWFHGSAAVVEFERAAEGVWDTSEEGNVVRGNTGVD